jgi:prevent-host-death family protein
MGKSAVSAADANRDFSKLLRGAKAGRSYTITSHGRPVARLVPVHGGSAVRAAAKRILFERLGAQASTAPVGRWTRDELYDR